MTSNHTPHILRRLRRMSGMRLSMTRLRRFHKMSGMRLSVLAMLCAVCAGLAFAARPKVDRQAREKARHYFAQASRSVTDDDAAAMYELARKAHQADPTYPEAAMMLAGLRLQIRLDTMTTPAEVRRTLAMAKQYVDTYPEDYDESSMYAYWCTLADTVPEALRVYQRLDTLFPDRHEVLLQLADAYGRLNRPKDAVKAYDRFEQVEGPSPQIGLRKISYYLTMRDTVGALAEADSMTVRNAGQPEYVILRGNVYEFLGDSVGALNDYLAAERLAPETAGPKLSLANYYASHGRMDLFDRKTYEAMLCEDLDLDQKLEMSAKYLGQVVNDSTDVSARSDALLNSLRQQYPHEPKVLELMSGYYRYRDMLPEAVESMEYAIDLDPANESYWLQLLSLQLQSEAYADAVQTYLKSEKHIGHSLDAMTLGGIAYTQSGHPQDAIALYLKALDTLIPGVDPLVPLEDTELPKVIGPENRRRVASFLSGIGDAFHELGALARSEGKLLGGKEKGDKEGGSLVEGVEKVELGDKEQSYVMYENSLLFDDSQPMVYNNYAYYLAIDGGDLKKAARLSGISLALDEHNPTYLDTYAWILYLSGEYDDALRHQLQAVGMAEEEGTPSAEYYDHLGDIYYRTGDTDKAIENWKKALQLRPDDKTIQNKVRQKRVL